MMRLLQVVLYGVSLSSGGFNTQLFDGIGHVRVLRRRIEALRQV